jgi:hypothetical protein
MDLTLILLFVIVINSAIMVYLYFDNRKSRMVHSQKTEALQSIIIELLSNQKEQHEKIMLADELKERLKFSKNKLNQEILGLQYEFLELLTRNNLLE